MLGSSRARRFARDVVSGKRVAPKMVILACERFQRDLKRKDLVFDARSANDAIQMLEALPHTKGKWAAKGQTLKLGDWQCFLFANLFGWKWKKSKLRRFRVAYIQIPRKNGKSIMAAGLGLMFFACDGEYGAEVYCGATSEKQAWEVFRPARTMCKKEPDLVETFDIEVNAKSLVILSNGSRFEPVIGKPGDGASPNCGIVDEFHEHQDHSLYDTFETGMGARDEPLMLITTTAGSSLGGPCHEMYGECRRQLFGEFEDDSRFVLIYEPDEGDQWDDPAVLRKVNPNYGVSINADFLKMQLETARRSAAKQNAFRTKHLNEWVGARQAWLNMLAWQRQRKPFDLEEYADWACYIAVDLASKIDLAAIAVLFRNDSGEYRLFTFFYAPEETVAQNDKYRQFELAGDLIVTPGEATDYGYIEQQLRDLQDSLNVLGVAMDPYQAEYLRQRLEKDGYMRLIEYRQTVQNMSDPMKEAEKVVLDRVLQHSGNTCMTWCMGNVMARLDEKGNIYPTKETKGSDLKIDGAVALIMAMGMWIHEGDTSSIYETGLGLA